MPNITDVNIAIAKQNGSLVVKNVLDRFGDQMFEIHDNFGIITVALDSAEVSKLVGEG